MATLNSLKNPNNNNSEDVDRKKLPPPVVIPEGLAGRTVVRGPQFMLVLTEDPSVVIGNYVDPDTGEITVQHPIRGAVMNLLVPAKIKIRHKGLTLINQQFPAGSRTVNLTALISLDDDGWAWNFTPVLTG